MTQTFPADPGTEYPPAEGYYLQNNNGLPMGHDVTLPEFGIAFKFTINGTVHKGCYPVSAHSAESARQQIIAHIKKNHKGADIDYCFIA